uniref:WD_REPEATS_REGION domain-containing protein n=2 Tax=Caenorhabditis japonica TaxID=281687 RepID=A0A8R1HKB2_CAEJA
MWPRFPTGPRAQKCGRDFKLFMSQLDLNTQSLFQGYNKVAFGGVDHNVKLVDIETARATLLGSHALAVRCMEFNPISSMIVTGGWDSAVKLWDARSYGNGAIESVTVSNSVYALDVLKHTILVGTKDRRIFMYDSRKLRDPLQVRDSPLKYQTRSVQFFPSGEAFVVSSIEGRVAVEYVDQNSEQMKKKYAFKCHREKEADGTELIHPVHTVAFHPRYGTFATGGADGIVNIWDPFNRKRIIQLHKFETSIASLSFNEDGSQLAIAASYQYEHEEEPSPIPNSSITIRHITDPESRPK